MRFTSKMARILLPHLDAEGTLSTKAWSEAGLPFETWLHYCKVSDESREHFHNGVREWAAKGAES